MAGSSSPRRLSKAALCRSESTSGKSMVPALLILANVSIGLKQTTRTNSTKKSGPPKPLFHYSTTPLLQHSITPPLQRPIIPSFLIRFPTRFVFGFAFNFLQGRFEQLALFLVNSPLQGADIQKCNDDGQSGQRKTDQPVNQE